MPILFVSWIQLLLIEIEKRVNTIENESSAGMVTTLIKGEISYSIQNLGCAYLLTKMRILTVWVGKQCMFCRKIW